MDAARRVVRAQNIANVHMTAKKFDLCGEQIALADEIKNDDFAPRYNIFFSLSCGEPLGTLLD